MYSIAGAKTLASDIVVWCCWRGRKGKTGLELEEKNWSGDALRREGSTFIVMSKFMRGRRREVKVNFGGFRPAEVRCPG
jgi:hypothetical protein